MTIESLNLKTIIIQILILFVFALIGFVTAKTKYLPESTGMIISKLVIKLTMPMTILTKMLGSDFNGGDYIDGVKLYFLAIFFLSLALGIAILVTSPLKIEETTKNVYKMQSMFGNVIFFAFPLFIALFGDKGTVYAIFFNMGNDTFLWTIGIFLANRHKAVSLRKNLKHLVNANTITFAIGIVLMLTSFSTFIKTIETPIIATGYTVFFKTVSMIGETTSPLSMIFIGMILAATKIENVKDLRKRYPLLIMSFQKLIFVPMIALTLMFIARRWFSDIVIMITVLQVAMPCGTLTASLAAEYGSDYKYATEGVFLSTVLCVVTLPFIAYLLKLIY